MYLCAMVILIAGTLTVLYFVLLLWDADSTAPDAFSCGSDEVCYCEKSKDCIKKR